jgi:hypothetical protein
LRRIVLIATALVVLVAAGAAYAAINSYTAKYTFTSNKGGTAAKPVGTGWTEDLTTSGTNGNRSAVLLDIKNKIYGLTMDQKDFPTCSLNQIAAAKNDTGCPKGAKVATGFITAALGSATNFSATAGTVPCDPSLDVWNSGKGKLTFFFVETAAHNCNAAGLQTGSTGPYPGTVSKQGKFMVVDTQIPGFVDFPISGVAGSLQSEHLVWTHQSKKVKGKTVYQLASVACQGKKRPYSTTFVSTLPTGGSGNETDTVSGTAACKPSTAKK